ncbi:MAG: 6-phosphogluconolactonase [Gammaproteobacteria bacterium]
MLEVFDSPDLACRAAAATIACSARECIAERGRFLVAFSGGRSPARMLSALAGEDLPWNFVHVFQVDERVAPAGHSDRNLTGLKANLLEHVAIPPMQIYPMPVESANLSAASSAYERTLAKAAGRPPLLDLVHLGLGEDGHTASLVPHDPVVDIKGSEVAVTGAYQGRRRMTMTYPILNRARERLWLVLGEQAADALTRMLEGDTSIPAGRVKRENSTVFADKDAAQR